MTMLRCEICGKEADRHHIIYRSQGGVDFPINFKYLCDQHHRGKDGPHKNRKLDLKYKLEMQNKLEKILAKEFYDIDELSLILEINKGMIRRLFKGFKIYKEGYKKSDIIYRLMGRKIYKEEMILMCEDFELIVMNNVD